MSFTNKDVILISIEKELENIDEFVSIYFNDYDRSSQLKESLFLENDVKRLCQMLEEESGDDRDISLFLENVISYLSQFRNVFKSESIDITQLKKQDLNDLIYQCKKLMS